MTALLTIYGRGLTIGGWLGNGTPMRPASIPVAFAILETPSALANDAPGRRARSCLGSGTWRGKLRSSATGERGKNVAEQSFVLVVDDDPVIRMFVGDILADNGFASLAASSADEAMGTLQNRHDIACVVTDVVMPGTLDGLGLVSEIRRRWTKMPVIVASGRMPSAAVGNAPDTVFLAKPFREPDLLGALAQADFAHT